MVVAQGGRRNCSGGMRLAVILFLNSVRMIFAKGCFDIRIIFPS